MKNKISDLRNHMFAQLERLSNEDLSPDELKAEIDRAKAVSEVGKVIVESAKTEVLHLKLTNRKGTPDFIDEVDFVEEPKKIERPPAVYSNKSAMGVAK
jgi:hypothetical protein